MAKQKYPKSKSDDFNSLIDGPAYVSWASDDKNSQAKAFDQYGKALEAASYSVANSQNRDFRNLTSYADGRPGLRGQDFDWFRPGQAAPTKPKDIIAYARFVYRRIGLIHNAIDLMGDFAGQGIRLVHPNKTIERFYNSWFTEVEGAKVTERLGHLLFREANVPLRFYTAKVNSRKRKEMQRAIAEVDLNTTIDDSIFNKNEIPWRYSFIDPLLVEPIGGSLTTLSKNKILKLKIPNSLRNDIKNLQQKRDQGAQEILSKISSDILRAVETGQDIILPPDKTRIYYYKKDDWAVWADPMTYSAFEPLNLYQRLQLTDKAALDGAMNKIRVWKIGSLEHKLAPTAAASSTLADMLGANVGGGTIDIVWGPDIELLETSSDIQSYLGEEKYRPTLMAIYASLGIPPTLTGTFGTSGTTNNFIALKTLVERLNYVRNIIIEFWNEQLKIIQKAMGFRLPASVEFDIMYLEDPAAMTTLLLNMADRNILSEEFVQRNVKAIPDIESRRIQTENKTRKTKDMEKVSPYHQVDQEFGLKKIALQTGISAPSEVGLKLEEKKQSEQSLMDKKETQMKIGRPSSDNNSGQPGRPKNSQDSAPRQNKTFKPKTKAKLEFWAKNAQAKIAEIINPRVLKSYNKSSLRNLTSKQFDELEQIKFGILCNLNIEDEISESTVARAFKSIDKSIHKEFQEWVDEVESNFDTKLTIDQIRDMRISYFTYYYGKNK